jgi:phospholipase C
MKNANSQGKRGGMALVIAMVAAGVAAPAAIRAMNGRPDRDDRMRRDDRDQRERTPVRHLVVIFQENVSFDHYFATYPIAANTDGSLFTAKPGTPLVNGLFHGGLLDHNPNSTQPFRLSHSQAVTCDQDHGYKNEQRAFDAGAMDTFPETVGVSGPPCFDAGKGTGLVMGYYDGNTTTALWNYAQNFAMNDNSFSTTFGPSTPGALNLIAGQTHGAILARDRLNRLGSAAGNVTAIDDTGVGTVIGDPRPSPVLDDCTLPSPAPPAAPRTYIEMIGRNVGDLLNERGVTWGWFQGGFRPTTPALGDVPAVCASSHASSLVPSVTDYIPHHEPFQYYVQTANQHHLPPTTAARIGHTDRANHQYDLEDFWSALDAGYLPAVSYLKAAAYQDGHAAYSDPLDEQEFLVNTINRLMQSPEWDHMAIIVAYDDSDGWYDHVMGPIVNQSNTPDDGLFGAGNCGTAPAGTFNGRCGFGPRQPFLVISPWARQNYVDNTLTDQSSVLRFIEDNWYLGRLGNQSTDAGAGSLLGMFDFNENHPRAPQLILDPSTGNP